MTSLNIHQRINAIMEDLDYIRKGPKTVNGQYRFASHDQVTAAVHPLLVKHKVNIVPSIVECKQEGNRTEMKVNINFVNIDTPTDMFCTQWIGYGVDPGDKGPGKAASYAIKYALLKTFQLETGDDPDNDANAVYEPAKCPEFDMAIGAWIRDDEPEKLLHFLKSISESSGKHIEDIKREALNKMEDFVTALRRWKPKKK